MGDPQATIVVPCRHEEGNVGPLLKRLHAALAGTRLEVLFVDDSDNHATVDAIGRAAEELATSEVTVTVVHRTGAERWGGLAGAVTNGLRRARADRVVVMDADLQHPPELVPALLSTLRGETDLVMASRYVEGGSSGGLSGPVRRLISTASTWLAHAAFPGRLRGVTDPMTGFFGLRRQAVDVDLLRADGFKILLEILARHPCLRRAEVPLEFDRRLSGDSKGDASQGVAYLRLLVRLRLTPPPRRRPAASVSLWRRLRDFALGGAAVAVLGTVLLEVLVGRGMEPMLAFGIQLGVTLALNFAFNYFVTWRDRARSGLSGPVLWFVSTRASTQFLSWLFFGLLTRFVGWHHQIANATCLVLVAAINFYLSDQVVFANAATRRDHRKVARWFVIGSATTALSLGLFALDPHPSVAVAGTLLGVALFNATIGALEVRWRLFGWRDPDVIDRMRWPAPSSPAEATETFSLIVPALNEAEVIGATLRRILESDYPHLEIMVSLCEGDHATIAEVQRVMRSEAAGGRIRTVIRAYDKSNKPRQLNSALRECTGTVVGVIDAEDDVAPGLLARVDALFRATGADVVQGGVQLTTLGRKLYDWFKVHNVLEYFFWFTSRVFYQVMCGFVPLGGNTVFIRRDLLIQAGGWPDNLTEDCALGVLLCTRYNAKVVAAYEADHATREEVPQTITSRAKGSLFWQRVRWNQGFLSVLLEREWLRLPTLRQRFLAGYILVTPFVQAISALLLPLAVATIFYLKVPVFIAMLMYAPFLPIAITMALQVVALREFSRAYRQKASLRHFIYLLVGAPFYQWVLMAAAFWAVVQHVQGNTTWHKTVHRGHHREDVALVPQLDVA